MQDTMSALPGLAGTTFMTDAVAEANARSLG